MTSVTPLHGNAGARRWAVLVATALVAAGLSACVPVASAPTPVLPPKIFPSDTQTVPDAAQLTGKRVTASGGVWEVPITDPNKLEALNFSSPPPTPSPACTGGT